jgi:oxaloacetate decarboxylase alpha subunit|tara:strand:+ start:619 stop:2400 length:1782 start_codon:yes stop_codon:yes gene_type:complete
MNKNNPLGITDVILRDAHQSILATRMRVEDMLPIAEKLDQVGFWSLESWGGATFDACIRYLGEDPWERLRLLKAAMPNTPQQMLLRGQNILGYRHYADDVVEKFVERAAINGVDVFRIFDAMNDMRNLTTAIKATLAVDKHAQGTISYTVSPVHTMEMWVDLAKEIEDLGAHSICIKDMAGLLKPYVAFDLVSRLKASLDIPVHMQCHATTGMSTATYLKAIEAGVDNVDTAISSMSMTYGHSATESLVAILQDEERDTGLNIELLEEIAGYFREVRKKYAQFEGAMRGVDSRILVAQVPGGMLTNLESQLREQNATERLDEVLEEIPKVREDLGFIPLVTPTSQIVGTQAVINVLAGERYKNVTKETAGVLAGEYGSTPAPLNSQLQKQVLGDVAQITCRPADLLAPELEALTETFNELAKSENIVLADAKIDDVLTYALFPQVATKFLTNRNNPSAFEPAPSAQPTPTTQASSAQSNAADSGSYTVTVDGTPYSVQIEAGSGSVAERMQVSAPAKVAEAGEWMNAGLAGTVHQVLVKVGDVVSVGQKILVLEAMKMETDISAAVAGEVSAINVGSGDQVAVGHPLVLINPS